MISPEDLLISWTLRDAPQEWCDRCFLLGEDEADVEWGRHEVAQSWNAEGRGLAVRLQAELGRNVTVVYFNEETAELEAVERSSRSPA